MFGWVRTILGGQTSEPRRPLTRDLNTDSPTPAELEFARQTLRAEARGCQTATAGGRPPQTRVASWWGGNFLAPAPPDMMPLCQILRGDLDPGFQHLIRGEALLVWFKPGVHLNIRQGTEFEVTELDALPNAPEPPETRPTDAAHPLRPLTFNTPRGDYPMWEDWGGPYIFGDDDWYGEITKPAYEDYAIKLGGWPRWCQGSQTQPGATLVLEIAPNDKSRFMYGDSGNLYLFRLEDGRWDMAGDFY